MSSMQAVLYDSATCDTEPIAIVEESIQALELTGNSNLLLIPSQFLPQCASLYVNNESTEYQISLAAGNVARSETPYLQLSAYLSEECGETADLQISLIADESIHPIGKFAPQTIREMRQTFNPDFVQTQQFNEDQTPIMLYYKATIAGTITVYSSSNGNQEAEVMQVPLQQFMDTCFNQNSPFPGFSTQSMKGRSDAKNMEALQSLVSALGSRTVHSDVNQRAVHPDLVKQRAIHSDLVKQRGVQPQLNKQRETGDESVEQRGLHPDVNRQRVVQPQLNKQREAGDETIEQRGLHPDVNRQRVVQPQLNKQREADDETIEQRGVQPDVNRQRVVQPQLNKQRDVADDVVNQDADHIANLFAGFNDHVRSRSQQGLPISFQITASTGPMVIDPSMQDQEWSTIGRPKPGHGKHGFKHHGLNKYMTPCQQEAGAMILGLLAVLLIIKMMMSRNQARRTTGVPPQMQERPVEKKNKDYVAVPTTSV